MDVVDLLSDCRFDVPCVWGPREETVHDDSQVLGFVTLWNGQSIDLNGEALPVIKLVGLLEVDCLSRLLSVDVEAHAFQCERQFIEEGLKSSESGFGGHAMDPKGHVVCE